VLHFDSAEQGGPPDARLWSALRRGDRGRRLVRKAAEDRDAGQRDLPANRYEDLDSAERRHDVDDRPLGSELRLCQVERDPAEQRRQRRGAELLSLADYAMSTEDREGLDGVPVVDVAAHAA
jgi:hypothetical protein